MQSLQRFDYPLYGVLIQFESVIASLREILAVKFNLEMPIKNPPDLVERADYAILASADRSAVTLLPTTAYTVP